MFVQLGKHGGNTVRVGSYFAPGMTYVYMVNNGKRTITVTYIHANWVTPTQFIFELEYAVDRLCLLSVILVVNFTCFAQVTASVGGVHAHIWHDQEKANWEGYSNSPASILKFKLHYGGW